MIADLPLGVFIVIVLFFVAMAVLAIVAGLTARKRAALVKATPTSPIGLTTDGYRELEGTIEAVAGPAVTAPLTDWPCAWYHATVERFQQRHSSHSDAPNSWVTIHEWTSGAPLLLRDATGVCIVDPARAEVTPTDKSRWYGKTEQPTDRNPAKVGPTESVQPMLEVASTGGYRYTEERIYAGDPLLALGEFRTHTFDAPDEDEDADGAAAQTNTAGPLTDDDAISAREDALFTAAHKITRTTISRGSGKQPLILTTTSQAKHVEMSEKGGVAAIVVALVPLGIALLLIWARFG
jgi:hypothetical protein